MHRLEAGHFAVEDCLTYIPGKIHRFYVAVVTATGEAPIEVTTFGKS